MRNEYATTGFRSLMRDAAQVYVADLEEAVSMLPETIEWGSRRGAFYEYGSLDTAIQRRGELRLIELLGKLGGAEDMAAVKGLVDEARERYQATNRELTEECRRVLVPGKRAKGYGAEARL